MHSEGLAAGLPLIRLNWSQFALIVAGLLVPAVIGGILLAPEWEDWHARRAVRQFQNEFGFESGTVVSSTASHLPRAWGITTVIAGGKFDRAGIRAGDTPVEHHGHGESTFYYALQAASRGETAQFEVLTLQDAPEGSRPVRRIVLPGVAGELDGAQAAGARDGGNDRRARKGSRRCHRAAEGWHRQYAILFRRTTSQPGKSA